VYVSRPICVLSLSKANKESVSFASAGSSGDTMLRSVVERSLSLPSDETLATSTRVNTCFPPSGRVLSTPCESQVFRGLQILTVSLQLQYRRYLWRLVPRLHCRQIWVSDHQYPQRYPPDHILSRRGAIAFACVISTAAVFIQFFTKPHVYAQLLVGKLFNGYALGMYVSGAANYCSEVSPLALRGITTGSVNLWIVCK
jgi:hypothetical protein